MNWNPGGASIASIVVWTIIAYVCGSLMFSVWIGRIALKRDIRDVGDGNPGSTNVIKAGGWKLGILAFLLDTLKGAIPVAIARYGFGIYGFALIPVCLAAMLGHAYSPFLGFKGGKALAVTAGVWTAITLWEIPTFGGIALGIGFALTVNSGWAVMFMLACLFGYAILIGYDPSLMALGVCTLALLAWKYRADLRRPPELRDWLKRRLGWIPTV